MHKKWDFSVTAKALQQVLALIASEESGESLVVSYRDNFERLWSLDEDLTGRTVFLLWDETPAMARLGQVDSARHLNPLAWAVCALAAHRVLRVVVVDLAPHRHSSETRLYRFIEAIRPERLPELRLIPLSAFGSYLAERASPRTEDKSSSSRAADLSEVLDALSHQIRIELTESGKDSDRHAIQNILGPLLLLGRSYLETRGPGERALLRLFEGTGLLPIGDARGSQPGKSFPNDMFDGARLRLLLVDDQGKHGWDDWVLSQLRGCGRTYLEVVTSPQVFLQSVEEECSKLGEKGDLRFAMQLRCPSDVKPPTLPPAATTVEPQGEEDMADVFSSDLGADFLDRAIAAAKRSGLPVSSKAPKSILATGEEVDTPTVLLLDLRLHATAASDGEAAFYLRLLSLCERFRAEPGQQKYAWPGFSESEIETVKAWCAKADRKRETPDHYAALSLLPRLLALLDPALPIVVFSTTTRREIVNQFRDYQNIITDFQKPVFHGGFGIESVIEHTQRGFHTAMRKAALVMCARRACAGLLLREVVVPRLATPRRSKLTAIFVDESGDVALDNRFSVGALVVTADSLEHLAAISAQMELSAHWGFSESNFSSPRFDGHTDAWYTGVKRQVPADYLPKNRPKGWNSAEYRGVINDTLSRVNDMFTSHAVQWAAAAFTYNLESAYVNAVRGELGGIVKNDIFYRRALRDLLRFCMEHVPLVRDVLARADGKLLIHVGTRELKAEAFNDAIERNELERRFGSRFRRTANGWGMCTTSGADVFPLVAGICDELSIPISRLCEACGVILHDYQSVLESPARMKVEERLPLQVHYLADWIAKCACWKVGDRPERIASWFKRGYCQERSSSFDELWSICTSAGTMGGEAEAIARSAKVKLLSASELRSGCTGERYLRQTASAWPLTMNGSQLASLIGRFEAD